MTKFNLGKKEFTLLAGKANKIISGSQDGPSLLLCCCDKMLTKFNLGKKEFGLQVVNQIISGSQDRSLMAGLMAGIAAEACSHGLLIQPRTT